MENKILIIKLGAIGDVLRSTSILNGLKEKYPRSSITWVTSKGASELLKNNSLIDNLYVIDEDWDKIKGHFDLVINLDEDIEACKLASSFSEDVIGFYLSDGEVKPSESAKEWFDMGALGKKPENDILKKKNRETYQHHLFKIVGIKPSNYEYVFSLTQEEKQFAQDFAEKKNISNRDKVIGINTGAGKRWQLKKWGIKKTAELIDRINNELESKLILFGGPEEEERNKKIKELAKTEIIDAGCNNTLREFAALVGLCDVLVTSDSLAMHLGIALKKKLVVLFGPTSSAEIELYGRGEKIEADIPCTCCYKKSCEKEPNCMDVISVDQVYAAVNGLLQ